MKFTERIIKAAANALGVPITVTAQASAPQPVAQANPQAVDLPAAWGRATFPPGYPIRPLTQPYDEGIPREIDYPVSANISIVPRTTYGLMPFSALADTYENVPEVNLCVYLPVREMCVFQPELISVEDGTPVPDHDFHWLVESPDRRVPWVVWLSRFFQASDAFDAGAFTIGTNGNGYLKSINYVDGTTLFVLVNQAGQMPLPNEGLSEMDRTLVERFDKVIQGDAGDSLPGLADMYTSDWAKTFLKYVGNPSNAGKPVPHTTPAFVQIIKGTPFAWYDQNQIWYRPRFPRHNAPYGRPAQEQQWAWVLLLANLVGFELAYYQQGNVPEGFFEAEENLSFEQVVAREDAFDSRMSTGPAQRRRARWFPHGVVWHETKNKDFPRELYLQARDNLALQHGIPPSEIGNMPGSGLGGKGMSEMAANSLFRMCLLPHKEYIVGAINEILRRFDITDVVCNLSLPTETIDPEKQRKGVLDLFINGIITLNDALAALNRDTVEGGDVRIVVRGGQVVVLDDYMQGGPRPGTPPAAASPQAEADDQDREVGQTTLDRGTITTPTAYSIPTATTTATDDRVAYAYTSPGIPRQKIDEPAFVKHCGVCPDDDEYYCAPISRNAKLDWPGDHHVNDVEIVAMTPAGLEPRPALWKPLGGENDHLQERVGGPQYVREEAAYLLDRSLATSGDVHLVPVAYASELDGEEGAAIMYVRRNAAPENVGGYGEAWICRAAVLDYVAGQTDRHERHNYFTHPQDDTRPVLFDNGLAFPSEPLDVSSPFVDACRGQALPADVLSACRKSAGDVEWRDIAMLVGEDAARLARERLQRVIDAGMIPAES